MKSEDKNKCKIDSTYLSINQIMKLSVTITDDTIKKSTKAQYVTVCYDIRSTQ